MIKILSKINLKTEAWLISLGIFFISTRIINLTLLPIFNDEATYIDWGFREINIPGKLFYSVMFAKPPFEMWLFGLAQKFFSNPLFAGRIVSVTFGLLTILGLYKTAEKLFSKQLALVSVLIYSIIPIFVFFDRQALMESAVGTIGVWSFYFLTQEIKWGKYIHIFALASTLAVGYFIKSSSFTFLITAIALLLGSAKPLKENASRLINNLVTILTVYFLILAPLLLQDSFRQTFGQNSKYIYTFTELANFPITGWLKNSADFAKILLLYFGPLLSVILLVSLIKLFKLKDKRIKLLLMWIVGNIALGVLLAKNINPRYAMPYLPYLCIVLSYYFTQMIHRRKILLLGVCLTPSLVITLLLITNPLKYFNILNRFSTFSMKEDYVTYWSSGYGMSEVINYLKRESENTNAVAAVRLDAGIPENAVFAYLNNSQNIKPTYMDSSIINRKILSADCIKTTIPIYFVSRDGNMAGLDKYFTELKKIYKPEGNHYIGIHGLKTGCKENTIEVDI